MPRILAIDYGSKRCGLAHTDPLKVIATPLHACATNELFPFLHQYLSQQSVEKIILGYPKTLQNTDTDATQAVRQLEKSLQKRYPNIPILLWDERFTSKMAHQTMLAAGLKKSDRRDKLLVDRTAAVILLQSYLNTQL